MGNARLRPWFAEDLARILLGGYGTVKMMGKKGEFLRGYLAALIYVAIAIGINPQEIIAPQDMQEVDDVCA